jgi:YbbR domain-containing protein
MPDGYWNGDVTLTPASISLTGAASELSQINNAVVELDLSDVTESVYGVRRYQALRQGRKRDRSLQFHGGLPYTTVQMDVLPTKTVPIDVMDSLVGTDEIQSGYKLTNVSVNPQSTVTIAADQEILDEIDSIKIETVNLAGASEPVLLATVSLQIPDGVTLISTDSYSVFIQIEEEYGTVNLYDIPIEIRNLADGYKASLSIEAGKVMISGR